MTEWAWVALGYGLTFAALAGYVVSLSRRAARVRGDRKESR